MTDIKRGPRMESTREQLSPGHVKLIIKSHQLHKWADIQQAIDEALAKAPEPVNTLTLDMVLFNKGLSSREKEVLVRVSAYLEEEQVKVDFANLSEATAKSIKEPGEPNTKVKDWEMVTEQHFSEGFQMRAADIDSPGVLEQDLEETIKRKPLLKLIQFNMANIYKELGPKEKQTLRKALILLASKNIKFEFLDVHPSVRQGIGEIIKGSPKK